MWKRFPWPLPLIVAFYPWNIANEYIGFIGAGMILKYFLLYAALGLIIFLASYPILRDRIRATIFAAAVVLLFLFWGPIHDLLRTIAGSSPGGYTFALPLAAVLLSLLLIMLKKKVSSPLRLYSFLVILFAVFVFIEAIKSVLFVASGTLKRNDLAIQNPLAEPRLGANKKTDPDIFYIVFDEYAGSSALHDYFQFDNSALDSTLMANSFHVVKGSRSNYNSTPHSIAATLNLDYHHTDLEGRPSIPVELLKGQYTVYRSRLPEWLSKNGYDVLNLGVMDLEGAPAPGGSHFDNEKELALWRHTLYGRVKKEIWWNVHNRLEKGSTTSGISKSQRTLQAYEKNFNRLKDELETEKGTPRFVYAHFMMPHNPFITDSQGNPRAEEMTDYTIHMDSLYRDFLSYTNKWIRELAEDTKHTGRPRVVVLQSDHGKRISNGRPTPRDVQFLNLSAVYFSDGDYSVVPDGMTNVNTFRVVLDKYWNTDLGLLKDSVVYIQP